MSAPITQLYYSENLYTFGTISSVHFMEVSWFQELDNMQMQHLGPQ